MRFFIAKGVKIVLFACVKEWKTNILGGVALRYKGLKRVETGCLLRNGKAKRRLRAKRKTIVARRFWQGAMYLFISILGNDGKGCEIVWFRKAFTM